MALAASTEDNLQQLVNEVSKASESFGVSLNVNMRLKSWSMAPHIYIYNSVLTRRHRHINSSASTPPNATKIAEMKVSHHGLEIVGPELLFSIYKCCFLEFVCAR